MLDGDWDLCKVVQGANENEQEFMLRDEAQRDFQVPQLAWFKKIRESVGIHSWMYAMIRIAGAEVVRQFGYDETSIDYIATFNQWCLIEEGVSWKWSFSRQGAYL